MKPSPHFRHLESAYQLHFYLCFKTPYLHPLFAGPEVSGFIGNIVEDVSDRHAYHLLDAQISSDHLRLVLSLKPEQAVARAVQMYKGNISRQFSLAYSELLGKYKLSRPLAAGYFARSCGKADVETVRTYVEQQAVHHGYRGRWTASLTYHNPQFRSPAFNLHHSVCCLAYQVVLVTKSRAGLFDECVARSLFPYLEVIAKKRGFAIDRISLMPDHLHLIMEGRPEISVADYALSIMNNTQCWMMKKYYGVLKATSCWDVWQPSFYAGTIGEYSTAEMRQFLRLGRS